MTRLWSCIALVVVCLLAAVASASAECAWVLWTAEVRLLPNDRIAINADWSPVSAFGDGRACSIGMTQRFGKQALSSVEGEFRSLRDGTTLTPDRKLALKCLPDTVDPRGPRGK